MKKPNIKNLKVWMLSITTAMALTMTSCASKTEQLHLESKALEAELESTDGTKKKSGNFEDIIFLRVNETGSNFSITIRDDGHEHEAELVFNTFKEIKEFISNCTNLEYITTYDHDIDILKAIPNPQKIISIDCSGEINQLDFLEKFPNIEYLTLLHASVKNIDSIANLKNLKNLQLWHSNIENINALENLTNLKYVDLSYMPHLENIDPIKNLTNITKLSLDDTKVKNIDILSNLKKLHYLTISNTEIEDFKALENLTELVGLKLPNTNLKSLYYLRNLKNLEKLDLSLNQLENIAIIKNFYKLKEINLVGNKIPAEQIENLGNEKSLHKLIISDIFGEELDVVEFVQSSLLNNEKILEYTLKLTPEQKQQIIEGQLTNGDRVYIIGGLGSLYDTYKVDENGIVHLNQYYSFPNLSSALAILKSCENIEKINLIDIQQKDQEEFLNVLPENIKKLKWIGVNIENISSVLSNHPELEQLIIETEGTFDIETIQNLKNLSWLNISADAIQHTDKLTNFENLLCLQLGSENLEDTDMKNIAENANLKFIDLNIDNILIDYSLLRPSSENNIIFLAVGNSPKTLVSYDKTIFEDISLPRKIIKFEDIDTLEVLSEGIKTKKLELPLK